MTTTQLLESFLVVLCNDLPQLHSLEGYKYVGGMAWWRYFCKSTVTESTWGRETIINISMRGAGCWLRLKPSVVRKRSKHANCRRYILTLRKLRELSAPTVMVTGVCIRRNHIYVHPYIKLRLKRNRPAWCTTRRQCLKIHSIKLRSLIVHSDGNRR